MINNPEKTAAILDLNGSEDAPLMKEIILESGEDEAACNMRNFLEWSPERKAAFIRAMEGGEFPEQGVPLTPNLVYARHRMVANAIMFSHQLLK